jgi:hypothetical protein
VAEDAVPRITLESGLAIVGPERVAPQHRGQGVRWRVMALDPVMEETAEKLFPSRVQAQGFIDQLCTGQTPADPLADDPDAPPRNATLAAKRPAAAQATPATLTKSHTRREPGTGGPGAEGAKDPAKAPFNLKAVADALIEAELDPFVEIAAVIKARRPVFDREGKPVVDEATGQQVTEAVINGLDRAKILVELGQYIAPKLKAVEMKVEDKRTLSPEELDRRIAVLLGKQAAPLGVTGNQ